MAVLMMKRLVGTLMGHLRRCAAPYARSSKQEHEPENLADLALEIFGPERGVGGVIPSALLRSRIGCALPY